MSFADQLLAWFDCHGRHDLPWQVDKTAYRVWVSEVMLQQTQVSTVVAYFQRFMQRFPDVGSLARADTDEVLHYWSGLGYYARARNLHKAAKRIVADYAGEFPKQREQLEALPGIGRSTAAAILAITYGQREAILDGNVKRVLCRQAGIEAWPGETTVLKQLWTLAERLTPSQRVSDYTQAIMDLGATVCTRTKPQCEICPVAQSCAARSQNKQQSLPARRPSRRPSEQVLIWLIVESDQGILLERRNNQGIWGGLWGFPEFDQKEQALDWLQSESAHDVELGPIMPVIQHRLTHRLMHIQPIRVRLNNPAFSVMEADQRLWYKGEPQVALGLAAPVTQLLKQLHVT
ncbi:A/G-specific DNA-adenine glycosylase [Ectothiorhodosinus mongolicus]|uniref:Adenine DNA glycosylase n=1 Tax=Ectothiorhodosinus mongolicus TaxID=233100 RepID=A0A1R3VZJ8_9GAMM|nr:A/G-specific adenine glycosylase [Ectothiorhodosinus mongolicus]ULX57221.1 A/G-specific adenine glycosylase [Ectothiorhodosinus mongolicus]SIT70491.1 A/G-specific DNA-adenine glycosylase [Ectothiorhodosinus mongolicus]